MVQGKQIKEEARKQHPLESNPGALSLTGNCHFLTNSVHHQTYDSFYMPNTLNVLDSLANKIYTF